MADLSKIVLQDGSEYNLKDAAARAAIAELEAYTDYLGVTTTVLTDGATTNPITIEGESVTAKKGNIANYGSKEFIFNGTAWQEFGDLSALGDLAYENTAEGSYTPAGTVTDPSVTIGGSATASKPNVTVTPTTTAIDELDSVGTLASCTMPTYTVDANGVLTITAGSYTAATLPTKKSTTEVVTGVSAELAAAPTIDLTNVTATATGSAFTGTAATITVGAPD